MGARPQDPSACGHPRAGERWRRHRHGHRQALHVHGLPLELPPGRGLPAARGRDHRPGAEVPDPDRPVTSVPETSEPLRNPLSLFDVSDRVAIITGASGALGRAIAVARGSLGCKLLLASGSSEPLEAVAEEVAGVGGTATTIVARPDSLEAAEAIVAAAVAAYGRVDSLVVASGLN